MLKESPEADSCTPVEPANSSRQMFRIFGPGYAKRVKRQQSIAFANTAPHRGRWCSSGWLSKHKGQSKQKRTLVSACRATSDYGQGHSNGPRRPSSTVHMW